MKKLFFLKIVSISFYVSFLLVFTNSFSANVSNKNEIFNAQVASYSQLAKALQESGELSSSFRTFHFVIAQRETDQIYDELYFNSLYEAMSIYPLYERERPNKQMTQNQIKDHKTLTSKIENGWLIIENIPADMLDEKNRDWIQEILTIFGMQVPPEDIHLKGNSFAVKLPSSCCCCKMQPESLSSDSEK